MPDEDSNGKEAKNEEKEKKLVRLSGGSQAPAAPYISRPLLITYSQSKWDVDYTQLCTWLTKLRYDRPALEAVAEQKDRAASVLTQYFNTQKDTNQIKELNTEATPAQTREAIIAWGNLARRIKNKWWFFLPRQARQDGEAIQMMLCQQMLNQFANIALSSPQSITNIERLHNIISVQLNTQKERNWRGRPVVSTFNTAIQGLQEQLDSLKLEAIELSNSATILKDLSEGYKTLPSDDSTDDKQGFGIGKKLDEAQKKNRSLIKKNLVLLAATKPELNELKTKAMNQIETYIYSDRFYIFRELERIKKIPGSSIRESQLIPLSNLLKEEGLDKIPQFAVLTNLVKAELEKAGKEVKGQASPRKKSPSTPTRSLEEKKRNGQNNSASDNNKSPKYNSSALAASSIPAEISEEVEKEHDLKALPPKQPTTVLELYRATALPDRKIIVNEIMALTRKEIDRNADPKSFSSLVSTFFGSENKLTPEQRFAKALEISEADAAINNIDYAATQVSSKIDDNIDHEKAKKIVACARIYSAAEAYKTYKAEDEAKPYGDFLQAVLDNTQDFYTKPRTYGDNPTVYPRVIHQIETRARTYCLPLSNPEGERTRTMYKMQLESGKASYGQSHLHINKF